MINFKLRAFLQTHSPGSGAIHLDTNEIQENKLASSPIQFTGQGSTYFKIWIMNTLLTLITLGIYSAWAKVRTKKYFYENTWLEKNNFQYDADPIAILKGRLIIGVPALLYFFGGHISIWLPFVSIFLVLILTPWLVVKSLSFNLSQTSHRGIKFGFTHKVNDSYKVHIKAALISIFTFGILYPKAYFQITRFKYSGFRFGKVNFDFRALETDFFKTYYGFIGIYLIAIFLFVLGIMGLYVVSGFLEIIPMLVGNAEYAKDSQSGLNFGLIELSVLFYFVSIYLIIKAFFAKFTYLIANGTSVGLLNVKCNLKMKNYLTLEAKNLFLMIFTLGLYFPYAKIKASQFILESISVQAPANSFDEFTQGQDSGSINNVAEAATDFWDVDIGV